MFEKVKEDKLLDKLIDTFDLLCKCFVVNYDFIDDLSHMYLEHNLRYENGENVIYLLDSTRQYLGLGEKVLHYYTEKHYRNYNKERLPTPVPTITYGFYPGRPRFCKDCDDTYTEEEDVVVEVPAIDRNFGRKISQIYFDKPDVFDKLLVLYDRDSSYNYYNYIHKYLDAYQTRIVIKDTYEELVKLRDTGKELYEITNDTKASYNLSEKLISTIFNIDDNIFKNMIDCEWLLKDFEDALSKEIDDTFSLNKHDTSDAYHDAKKSYTIFLGKTNPNMYMTIEPMDSCLNLIKNDARVQRKGSIAYGSSYCSMDTITERCFAEYKPSLKLSVHHGALSLDNATTIDIFDSDCVDRIFNLIISYTGYHISQDAINACKKSIDNRCTLYRTIRSLKECCNIIINNSNYVKLDKKINVSPDRTIMITLDNHELDSLIYDKGVVFKKKVPGKQKNIETVYICDKNGHVHFRCKLACINYLRDMNTFLRDIKIHHVEDGITKENIRKYFNGKYKAYIFKEVKRTPSISYFEAPIMLEDFYINKPPTTYQYVRSIRYNDYTRSFIEQELAENNSHRKQSDEF